MKLTTGLSLIASVFLKSEALSLEVSKLSFLMPFGFYSLICCRICSASPIISFGTSKTPRNFPSSDTRIYTLLYASFSSSSILSHC